MASSVNITVTGNKEIDKVLKELPLVISHKLMGSVHFQAAQIVVKKEKLLAPEGPTGNLVDSIGATKRSLKRATEIGEVWVGPRQNKPFKGRHGKFNEFGTGPRETTGKKSLPAGLNRGQQKAKPFAKPTFEATKGQVEGFIAKETEKIMVKTMKRYIK